MSKFQEDIQSNLATADKGLSLEEMVDHFKATILVLDENTPLKTKWLQVYHQQPWFSDKDQGGDKALEKERKCMAKRSHLLHIPGIFQPMQVLLKYHQE